jgi:hypothetical protein
MARAAAVRSLAAIPSALHRNSGQPFDALAHSAIQEYVSNVLSFGLIVNFIFVVCALYVYYRSWHFLHEVLAGSWAGITAMLRRLLLASGLTIMFSAGTLMMIAGLTGLTNRLIIALQ